MNTLYKYIYQTSHVSFTGEKLFTNFPYLTGNFQICIHYSGLTVNIYFTLTLRHCCIPKDHLQTLFVLHFVRP